MSHFKQDKDGGFHVSKTTITVVGFILLLLGALIPIVLSWGSMGNNIDRLDERIKMIEPRLDLNTGKIITIEVKIDTISENVKEIKDIIKEMKK